MNNTDLKSIGQPFSNKIDLDGKTFLYFGGTAYLGIPQNAAFVDLYIKGIKKFGLNNGTSRNNNVQLGIYNEAEAEAAARFGAEDALITSSGYLAAQMTVKVLSVLGNAVYAPGTHPALWLNEPPTVTASSFTEWANETVELINSSTAENWVLISNSMNNLFPEIFDFGFIELINADKNITLIIDDSHGIGINNNGLGALAKVPRKKNVTVVIVASMAKALGVDAGVVLGPKMIIDRLKETNVFVGASPPAAAGLYAFIGAAEIYKQALEKLQENISQLCGALAVQWKFANGFPAFLIDDAKIDQALLTQQILISSFPYPNKDSDPINRIILSSWHTREDINQLIAALS